jgi:hypothetical protein
LERDLVHFAALSRALRNEEFKDHRKQKMLQRRRQAGTVWRPVHCVEELDGHTWREVARNLIALGCFDEEGVGVVTAGEKIRRFG